MVPIEIPPGVQMASAMGPHPVATESILALEIERKWIEEENWSSLSFSKGTELIWKEYARIPMRPYRAVGPVFAVNDFFLW